MRASTTIDRSDPLWYKDAIIYQLHVKAFFDSNNDGIGDFRGLTEKLDYLKDLGISAVWILPFYPSPLRDDGYDISDYKNINSSYGTMGEFRRFVKAAHARGIRVITELVINHTSDQHPWFQRARKARKGSKHRDWYVWSDDDRRWPETRIIFTDTEVSNWAWDPVAQQYYWHRFFSHQPDLNFDNPRVVEAVTEVMRFWLDSGVDGLRLDAIPYLVERDGTSNENLPESHHVLKQLRSALDETHAHAFFLAEANQWPEDTAPYFGDGDECHMAFHFPLMPRMYMAIAMEDRFPITDIMRQTPDIPSTCQWAIFLRNHDELTLEMVTDRERDYLWRFYAAEPRARLNLGIRRRLAPLMENDRRKIELMNSLLFSMPGTPIIYYGDEIGMGDNIFLGDRDSVRTPMQWSPDRNGGFSRADPARVYLPPIMNQIYGFDAVNVEAQQRSSSSQLNWMKRLIAVRQQHRAFGRGSQTFLYPGNRKILAYLRELEDEIILCVANLSRQAQAVELDLSRFKGRVPVELLGRSTFPPIGDLPYLLTAPPYAFYWFLLEAEAELPRWHEPIPEPMPDLITLVMSEGWNSLTKGRMGQQLVREVLPPYVANQRWFAAKDAGIAGIRVIDGARIPGAGQHLFSLIVETDLRGYGKSQRYFLPVASRWDETAATTVSALLPYTLAKIRRGPSLGALIDAAADPSFAPAMVQAIRAGAEVDGQTGRWRFEPGSELETVTVEDADEVRRLGAEQSNTSIIVGEKMILKAYRRLSPGIHPEVEMGRFLTEVAGYANTPALLGSVVHVSGDGTPTALAILQRFERSQGNGWDYTLEYLQRHLEEMRLGIGGPDMSMEERHAVYLQQAATLGRRTAELHRALALDTGNPNFDPEPMTADDMAGIETDVLEQANHAFSTLEQVRPTLSAGVGALVSRLIERRDDCQALIRKLVSVVPEAAKTRHHGDYHLGQVLVAGDDFILVDFEGEPRRGLAERRAKKSPMRDVAGMVRSFDYAAWAGAKSAAETSPDWYDELLGQAMTWRRLATEAFLGAYRAFIGDCVSFPPDAAVAQQLLDLLILEKALYEINYEAANRPGWLSIPTAGVIALLDAPQGEAVFPAG
ncbi:MAG: maltose alpha-D-glucosyltransferase [Alphaproteobacteria bacterium]|jgi:maltose alpha-D-glucosyltransferase/alpha-amylase|nr:maltose alpha-D-glucosyltransferase [Alphaproteobacteria bacterium]